MANTPACSAAWKTSAVCVALRQTGFSTSTGLPTAMASNACS